MRDNSIFIPGGLETNERLSNNSRSTPQDFFDLLDKEFHFTLDPCCTIENHKCSKYYTESDNGLIQSWAGERVFMNPPYRDCYEWLDKAALSERYRAEVIVCLLPARTDTAWYHELVLGIADEIRFVRGRLKFGGSVNSAPFPSIVVVYWPRS